MEKVEINGMVPFFFPNFLTERKCSMEDSAK